MKIEFWGTREVGRRSELDFAFPARERAAQAAAERKREAEKKAEEEEKALLEDVKMKDEEGDEFVWVDDGEVSNPSARVAGQLLILRAPAVLHAKQRQQQEGCPARHAHGRVDHPRESRPSLGRHARRAL